MTTTFLVFTKPVVGREDEYNKWYDEVHLPDVVAVDGVSSGQRFEHVAVAGGTEPAHSYLAIYELDGDPDVVLQTFAAQVASGKMVISEALDTSSASMAMWRPRGDRLETPA